MIQTYIRAFTQAAKAAGIRRLKYYAEERSSRTVSVYRGELEQMEREAQTLVFVEGETDGFAGSVFVEDLDPSLMETHIRQILAAARCEKRPFAPYTLPAHAGEPEEPPVFLPLPVLLARLCEAEQAAYDCDSRIEQVQDCHYKEACRRITLADSEGNCVTDRDSGGNFYIALSARDGQQVQAGGRGTPFLLNSPPDVQAFARQAALDALSRLNAASYPTGPSPVVLDSRVVCELLDAFLPAFFAKNVQNRMSVLAGKLGQAVAGSRITLREDPMLPGGLSRRRFDDEGVPTRAKEILSRGILQEYLYDRQSAKADGRAAGGNGFKASFKEGVSIGFTNLVLCPGQQSQAELLAEMDSGLLITGVNGVFAGVHPASGDFSLIAHGYRVRHGRCCGAVGQITIAGNFFDMLRCVRGVGCDGKWMRTAAGCIRAPSLHVGGLMISGQES